MRSHLVSRKSDYRFIPVSLLAALFAAIVILASNGSKKNVEDYSYTYVRVYSGDTLWTLCKDTYGESVDVRKCVEVISEINHIDGFIYPGQNLRFPEIDFFL